MTPTDKFPGGFPDFSTLMQQAQRMQEEMARSQSRLAAQRIEASAGGGMVHAVFSGARELLSLRIDPSAIDPADPSLLQDLLVAAINQGLQKIREAEDAEMQHTASSVGLPTQL